MSSESHGYYRGHLPGENSSQLLAEVTTPPPVSEPDKHLMARQQGFTGNTCIHCGGVHMQMAGHCEVCSDCGTTTGCS